MVVYLWISEFKNLRNIGFNFTSKFNIQFNQETSRLSIEENKGHISNFFGSKIKDVVCLAGENGVGKSNILEYLIGCISLDEKIWEKKHILIIENNNKLVVYQHSSIENLTINNRSFVAYECFYRSSDTIEGIEYLNKKVIYYSNFFDGIGRLFQNLPEVKNVIDISTNGILLVGNHYEGEKTNLIHDSITAYKTYETFRQLQFYIEWEKDYLEIINLPDSIKIFPVETYNPEEFLNLHYFNAPNLKDKLLPSLGLFYQKIPAKKDYEILFKNLVFSILYDHIFFGKIEQVLTILQEVTKLDEDVFSFPQLIDILTEKLIDGGTLITIYNLFLENSRGVENYISIPFSKLKFHPELILLDSGYLMIRRFFPFEFQWEYSGTDSGYLSTGENAILTLFSRINSLGSPVGEKYTILLDEPDLGFHPEWQRKFLFNFLTILKALNTGIEQIIISTHSPFILSDLPNDNIIYLRKEGKETISLKKQEKPNSFGANIHELLSESFFLQNGLIGEFAKSKIKQMFDYFDKNKKLDKISEDEFEKILPIIGEPLISSKLAEMYAINNGDNPELARLLEMKNKIDRQIRNINQNDTDKE